MNSGLNIMHLFNSSVVSGPERLVLPALASYLPHSTVSFLVETRKGDAGERPLRFAQKLGLATDVVRVKSRIDLDAITKLRALIQKNAPQIVHAHDAKASLYTLLAARGLPVRLISTHHGIRGRKGFRARCYELIYRFAVLPFFDLIMTVCESDFKRLSAYRILQNKVRLHRNGVDLVPKERGAARAALKLNRFTIGYAGRLSPEKGVREIITMANHLRELPELPPWSVVIVGEGPLEHELKAEVDRLGLQEFISFAGYRSEIAQELSAFDLLLTLAPAEGLPLTVLEAGYCMTPVAARCVDGVAEILSSPEFGVTIAPDESPGAIAQRIAHYLREPAKLEPLARALNARVTKHYSGRAWVQQLVEFYTDTPLLRGEPAVL